MLRKIAALPVAADGTGFAVSRECAQHSSARMPTPYLKHRSLPIGDGSPAVETLNISLR
jgi:hypothetical protein